MGFAFSLAKGPIMSPEFLLTSMIVILLPGTGVIYTLAFGLGKGLVEV